MDDGRWLDDLANAYCCGKATLHDILSRAFSRGVDHRFEAMERYVASLAAGQPVIIKGGLWASPEACAAADAWAAVTLSGWVGDGDCHTRALDALELATRNSPLRKVKP